MYITYYAPNTSMGETSDVDCDKYRAWAEEELEREYPDHFVFVSQAPGPRAVDTDDMDNEDTILDFCSRLWDRCPWDWA